MTFPIASKTKLEMRQAIGYNLGAIIVSGVTATGAASTSLIDTYGLAKGGADEYNGRQVQINVPASTAGIATGERSFVSDFAATSIATMVPAFTAAPVLGDTYEMWSPPFTIEQVDDVINQAIISATDDILQDKVDSTTLLKLAGIYEYAIPSGFVALHTLEYEYGLGVYHLLEDCEDAWTAAASSITATADSTFEKVGTSCAKFVEDGGAGAGDVLCYEDITSVDISDCDKVEFWMYSSIALTAGQLDFVLDSATACAGTLESINIPAMTAATWYRHSLSLANPHSDTAILSIGVTNTSDVGVFTFYIDNVEVVKENSRIYKELNPGFWSIVQATTNLLQLSPAGHSIIGNNRRLRLSGYQIPAELSDDITDCTIDPDYVIAKATAYLLMAHAGGSQVDVDDRLRRSERWMGIAEKRLLQARTSLAMNTRWVS